MARRGPKPAPTAIKRIRGERPDRINESAPELAPGTPDPPASLGPAAADEWARICAELAPARILTAADRALVALYCEAYARWQRATSEAQRLGLVTRTAAGGLKINPYVTIAQSEAATMLRALAEIGGTPSARSRLATEAKPEDESAALAAFIAAG